jgi:hypothetical protein
VTETQLCLTWASTAGRTYHVEGSLQIAPATWNRVSNDTVATTDRTTLCLPRTTPYPFFRVLEHGSGTNPPPTVPAGFVAPTIILGTNGVCLEWASTNGVAYRVEGATVLTGPWATLSTNRATAAATAVCLDPVLPYQFFRVSAGTASGGTTNPPNPTPAAPSFILLGSPVSADGRFQLQWASAAGVTYRLEFANALLPPQVWSAVQTFTGTGNVLSYQEPGVATQRAERFYRLVVVP